MEPPIADPEMHAISAVTLHPSTKYWSGQSMDNQSEWLGGAQRHQETEREALAPR